MTCAQIATSIKVWNALKDKVSWKVTITKVDFPALHVETHYGQIKFVREMLTKGSRDSLQRATSFRRSRRQQQ